MDKSEFIGFYKLLIASNSYAPSNIGHAIISSYIEDEGNDYHKAGGRRQDTDHENVI